MATMIDGESYVGRVLVRPLSESGDVTLFLWPLRCLRNKIGGPTFGIDIKGEEIIRFDPHGSRGHWHKGGYDKLGAGGSQQLFPEGLVDSEPQVSWSLEQIRESGQQLLEEAGHPEAAASLDTDMVSTALDAVRTHLAKEGDLRSTAIAQGLLEA